MSELCSVHSLTSVAPPAQTSRNAKVSSLYEFAHKATSARSGWSRSASTALRHTTTPDTQHTTGDKIQEARIRANTSFQKSTRRIRMSTSAILETPLWLELQKPLESFEGQIVHSAGPQSAAGDRILYAGCRVSNGDNLPAWRE